MSNILKKAIQRPKNEPIVFTSEDSMNTDNSFNSSIDGENNEDYKNSFWHLKEQIQQFFLQNPGLQSDIKFEQNKFSDDDSEEDNHAQGKNAKGTISGAQSPTKKSLAHKLNSATANVDAKKKSRLWTALSKDIIRNGQFSQQQVPTLETVNHRLNIFKKKLEKVDYLEILTKDQNKDKKHAEKEKQKVDEKEKDKEKDKQQQQQQKGKDQSSEEEDQQIQGQEIEYYSFKKRQQKKAEEKREKQLENMEKMKTKHRSCLFTRGGGEANMFNKNMIINGQIIYGKVQGGPGSKLQKRETVTKYEDTGDRPNIDTDMEFHSQFGKVLYQTLKQYQNDVESFKKTAAFILRDYNNNKTKLYKQKAFPPQIQKFTSDETKSLNILLPDFSNQMQQNKNQIFQGLDNYSLPEGTPEAQFVNTIDSILNGRVMELWKQAQNNG